MRWFICTLDFLAFGRWEYWVFITLNSQFDKPGITQ